MKENNKIINPCTIDETGDMKNNWTKLFLMNPRLMEAILGGVNKFRDKFGNLPEDNEYDALKEAMSIYKLSIISQDKTSE